MKNLLTLIIVFLSTNLSAQNIGIGTSSPLAKLHVIAGDSGVAYFQNQTLLGTNVNTGVFFKASNFFTGEIKTIGTSSNTARLAFFTFASIVPDGLKERMSIMDNGNVGIGTTNPLASLEVTRGTGLNGTAAFMGTTNTSHFNYSAAEDTYIRGGLANSKVFVNDISSGNVSIAAGGGSVGIGTASPGAKLHIAGNIKIVDGTQAANNVLTSDASGGATWKPVPDPIGVKFSVTQGTIFTIPNNVYTQILFGTKFYDASNSFNSGNFIAPVTAVYHFDTDIQGNGSVITNGGYDILELRVNTIPVRYVTANFPANNYLPNLSISCDLSLNSGDIVKVYFLQSSANSTTVGGTEDRYNPHFTGHRVF